MKRVYISVINDLVTDQRVHRVVDLLTGQGLKVVCIGRKLRGSPQPEGGAFSHRRFRMLFKKGPLFYACFNIRLFVTLLFVRGPALFIANDLDTLPASFMAGRIRKVRLIYDSHELFTQVPELIQRKRVQAVWKWLEYRYVTRLDYAVTVSYSIGEIYRRLYKTRFRVVRNVPVQREPCPDVVLKEELGGKKMIIYQGSLNVGRGLELVIDTMQYLDSAVFVIVGTGDIEEELRTRVKRMGLEEKVIFKGRLSPARIIPITCAADLGVSLEEDRGLNYRYALPNKLFDYIQARVPVLCTSLPEMTRIVRTYGVGVATSERDPEKLAGLIRYILEERSQGAWREALDKAAGELCWEKESQVYLDLIRETGVL
jgi:glycosyltransferase involved in cell wall biosynthesis